MLKYYKTIKEVVGSIMVVEDVAGVGLGELCTIIDQNGNMIGEFLLENGKDDRGSGWIRLNG